VLVNYKTVPKRLKVKSPVQLYSGLFKTYNSFFVEANNCCKISLAVGEQQATNQPILNRNKHTAGSTTIIIYEAKGGNVSVNHKSN